jgi:hypothetical protein
MIQHLILRQQTGMVAWACPTGTMIGQHTKPRGIDLLRNAPWSLRGKRSASEQDRGKQRRHPQSAPHLTEERVDTVFRGKNIRAIRVIQYYLHGARSPFRRFIQHNFVSKMVLI